MEPLLSICVPSYNVSAYLEKALASYDDERLYGRLEVIVVNDGSTDDGATEAIAQRFCAKSPEVFHLISKENGGHGSGINAALAVASGRYFRVIDADDWATTDELARFVGFLEGADADVVVDVKTEEDMETGAREVFELPEAAELGRTYAFDEVCGAPELVPYLMIHTLTFSTGYLRSTGLHLLEKTFYEDYEYVVKGTLDAASLRFVPYRVYNYLVGNASQSVADASYVARYADHRRVVECICDLYEARVASLTEARAAYLFERARLICNTHYNICLIFDDDRARGMRRAQAFRAYLEHEHRSIAQATERRYRVCCILHHLGVSSQAILDKLGKLRAR